MIRRVVFTGVLSLAILLALAPYLWPQPALRQSLTELGSTLLAYATLVAFLAFLEAHLRRIGLRGEGWPYSLLIVLSALAVLLLAVGEGWLRGSGLAGPWMMWIYQHGVLSLEASLGALLPFFMILALWRRLRTRPSVEVLMFTAGVLSVLILRSGGTSLPNLFGPLSYAVIDPLITGGVRGILLGVALGVVILMLRIVLGLDRPMGR
ncbi:MAG: hypothetical protein J7452_08945 [Thermoflexus sp.]|jgi:hypothetical protein|nr:hypothetical protein [Thermoflexus sp.]